MPKSLTNAKPTGGHKRARIDAPKSIFSGRIKGSPKPARSAKADKVSVAKLSKSKGKEKAADEEQQESSLPSTFKVVAGSYEKLLYGLEGSTTAGEGSDYTINLKPIFAFPAHVSCIKAVSASPNGGKWLATGSADEIVKVWDLRRKKEIGGLMHHEGSITHLTFPSRSHLLSASEDGTLCLFRARDWSVLRTLKGHKGRVNSVAVHPSGKVALSVGKDRTLRMWDLMRGKGSASTKLGKEGELVRWSSDGSLFVVQTQSTIDVYTTEMDMIHTITHKSRLHDVRFCPRVNGTGDVLFACAEDKNLSIYELSQDPETPPKIIATMTGHTNRVKAVDVLPIALPPSTGRESTTVVCTISSDGMVHIYDMAALPDASKQGSDVLEITPAAVYDTKKTRLTCVTLADGAVAEPTGSPGKRKRNENSDSEDEDGDEAAGEGEEEDEEEGEGEAEIESD
ncbi:hypothetical protein HGRIS_005089 [Hohenbuehelia grisea]|uniref:WD40 repeat-like protein n=1 Tax=Hohenbuehelia grisea TaxID=104357 RepID=A0ABR3JDZ2_9AGAR